MEPVHAAPRLPRTVGRARALVRACHPGPTVVVTLAVTALAAAAGRSAVGCAGVLLAVLLGQFSVGWSNDARDAARDAAVGRIAKPTVSGAIGPVVLLRLALLALVVALALSVVVAGAAGALCHAVFLASAWAYNLGLKSTPFSLVPYAIGFGALPGFVTYGLEPAQHPDWRVTVAAGLLGLAAGLANAAPDVEDDRATGVHGAVGRLGAHRARALCVVTLVAATAVLVVGYGDVPTALGGAATVGVVVLGIAGLRYRAGALLFPVVLVIALLDVALLAVVT